MFIRIHKRFALWESSKFWPESEISTCCLISDFVHSFGRIWCCYGELHGALVTPNKGNKDSPSADKTLVIFFAPKSLQNKLDPAAQVEHVIHFDRFWSQLSANCGHPGLWYLGDASKVFMLANHALTRRYLRSGGQLVGRRLAFFQDVHHCFPKSCCHAVVLIQRYHPIKTLSVHAGRCTSHPMKRIVLYRK